MAPDPEAASHDIPVSIGKYRVIEHLGRGGQGEVFRAVHPDLGRDVVIKLAHSGVPDELHQRLLDEGRILVRLKDPGVVQVHDVDVHEGRPFLVFEYVAGCSLADRLKHERLSFRAATALVAEVARILERCHRQRVFHLDLKPANILLDPSGRPRLIDFGLACLIQRWHVLNPPGEGTCGTFQYMAPEQANGLIPRIGPRSDLFSLGAVLYELLTGRPPYQGTDWQAVWKQAREGVVTPPRQLNPRISRTLERICLKAMATDPDQRYASAAALEQALRRSLRRPRLLAAGLLLIGLVVASLLAWTFFVPPPAPLPAAAVSAAVFNNQMYLFATGKADHRIYVNSSADGDRWSGWNALPDRVTKAPPDRITDAAVSAVAFKGQLYLFVKGEDDHRIYVNSTADGRTWKSWNARDNQTDVAVNALAYSPKGRLYLFYKEKGNRHLHVISSADGISWDGWSTIPHNFTDVAVSTVEFKDRLYVFSKGVNIPHIFVDSSADGDQWSGVNANPNLMTDVAVSAVALHGRLYLFAKREADERILVNSSTDGVTWNGWNAIPDGLTDVAVGAVAFKGRLYLFAKRKEYQHIHVNSTADGNQWSGWNASPDGLTDSSGR